jgi:hypothetical protein
MEQYWTDFLAVGRGLSIPRSLRTVVQDDYKKNKDKNWIPDTSLILKKTGLEQYWINACCIGEGRPIPHSFEIVGNDNKKCYFDCLRALPVLDVSVTD